MMALAITIAVLCITAAAAGQHWGPGPRLTPLDPYSKTRLRDDPIGRCCAAVLPIHPDSLHSVVPASHRRQAAQRLLHELTFI